MNKPLRFGSIKLGKVTEGRSHGRRDYGTLVKVSVTLVKVTVEVTVEVTAIVLNVHIRFGRCKEAKEDTVACVYIG